MTTLKVTVIISVTCNCMAKLYAEITSDKGGRVVGKGGDKQIIIRTKNGNKYLGTIELYYSGGITRLWYTEKNGQKSKLLERIVTVEQT